MSIGLFQKISKQVRRGVQDIYTFLKNPWAFPYLGKEGLVTNLLQICYLDIDPNNNNIKEKNAKKKGQKKEQKSLLLVLGALDNDK